MICKNYTQAVDVAKIQADRTGKPWRVFRDSTYRWISEPHEGTWKGSFYGRYEIFHAAHQLEFDFTPAKAGAITTGVTEE